MHSCLLLLTLALAPAPSPAPPPFEGTVNAIIQVHGQTLPTEYTIKGHRVRINIQLMQHTSSVIADTDTQTQTVLIPQAQAYAIHHGTVSSKIQPAEMPKIKGLKKTETIAGHVCEDYSLESPKYAGTVCVAKDIGSSPLNSEIAGPLQNAMKGLEAIKNPGMPLRLELTPKDQANNQSMVMLVTRVSPGVVSDSEFTVPAGWHQLTGFPQVSR